MLDGPLLKGREFARIVMQDIAPFKRDLTSSIYGNSLDVHHRENG